MALFPMASTTFSVYFPSVHNAFMADILGLIHLSFPEMPKVRTFFSRSFFIVCNEGLWLCREVLMPLNRFNAAVSWWAHWASLESLRSMSHQAQAFHAS